VILCDKGALLFLSCHKLKANLVLYGIPKDQHNHLKAYGADSVREAGCLVKVNQG